MYINFKLDSITSQDVSVGVTGVDAENFTPHLYAYMYVIYTNTSVLWISKEDVTYKPNMSQEEAAFLIETSRGKLKNDFTNTLTGCVRMCVWFYMSHWEHVGFISHLCVVYDASFIVTTRWGRWYEYMIEHTQYEIYLIDTRRIKLNIFSIFFESKQGKTLCIEYCYIK